MSNSDKIISFRTKIGRLDHLVGMHYIEIPKQKVGELGGKFNIRLICRINNLPEFQCGIVALGEGKGYISINAERMKKGKLKNGDSVNVNLMPDESEYGMPFCDELKELFIQDKEAKKRFDGLTKGKQRYIIYYVQQVKSPHLRLQRALKLITNLKQTKQSEESFRQILGVDN